MKIKSIKDNIVFASFTNSDKPKLGEFEIVEFSDKEKTNGLMISANETGAYFAILAEEHKLSSGMEINPTGKILKIDIPLSPLGKIFDYRGQEMSLHGASDKIVAKTITTKVGQVDREAKPAVEIKVTPKITSPSKLQKESASKIKPEKSKTISTSKVVVKKPKAMPKSKPLKISAPTVDAAKIAQAVEAIKIAQAVEAIKIAEAVEVAKVAQAAASKKDGKVSTPTKKTKPSKVAKALKASKVVMSTMQPGFKEIFKFKTAKTSLEIEPEIINLDKRSLVNRTLRMGTLLVDSTLAIGKGQRELIIGDRQTGKTSIALDAIISQKGQNVICIYNMIGGKTQDIIRIYEKLKQANALEYSLIIASTSSDSSIKQWLSPYVATTFAEAFRDEGQDVLIVYDDLSAHAKAYRSFNLLMGAHPGREAYPGDIFYIHSRLLERSGQFNSKAGGGSITALPVVQTEKGNISAYVPTNIISITDGQIFTNSEMFNKNIRPAVDINLSVSRVGSNAQTKYMKASVGTLKSLIAQYSKIKETFISESALSPEKRVIYKRGQIVTEIFIQRDSQPWSYELEWILILLMNNGHFDNFELKDIQLVKKSLNEFANSSLLARRFLKYIGEESEKNYNKEIMEYFALQVFIPFIKWLGSDMYSYDEEKVAIFKSKYAEYSSENYEMKPSLDSYELYSSDDEIETEFTHAEAATKIIKLEQQNGKGGK